jgi:hypothetical protein
MSNNLDNEDYNTRNQEDDKEDHYDFFPEFAKRPLTLDV